MHRILPLLALTALAPLAVQAKTLKEIVDGTIVPLGDLLINLMYALAFLFFMYGVAKFFFAEGAESREKARDFAMWSLVGFFVLFGVWGLVNLLLNLLSNFSS